MEVADALQALGVEATRDGETIAVDGTRLHLHLVARAHPTPADLADLVGRDHALPAVVVADRISDAGRDVLRQAGWGWLDRRGHLRLWAPGARVETALPAAGASRRSNTGNAWTTVGLEIALATLLSPTEPVSARRVAARIGRSVGATHDLIGRFVELGLIGKATHLPLLPEMFWETAARWPDDGWMPLPVGLDIVAAKLGAEELVRVDERAATLGGARIPAAGDLPARCYVPSAGALRRARALVDRERPTRCWIRRSPVDWLPENTDHPPDANHPWRVAHPVVCALRLGADPARGREVVDSWGIVPGTR